MLFSWYAMHLRLHLFTVSVRFLFVFEALCVCVCVKAPVLNWAMNHGGASNEWRRLHCVKRIHLFALDDKERIGVYCALARNIEMRGKSYRKELHRMDLILYLVFWDWEMPTKAYFPHNVSYANYISIDVHS